jgi:hypothetical protein
VNLNDRTAGVAGASVPPAFLIRLPMARSAPKQVSGSKRAVGMPVVGG